MAATEAQPLTQRSATSKLFTYVKRLLLNLPSAHVAASTVKLLSVVLTMAEKERGSERPNSRRVVYEACHMILQKDWSDTGWCCLLVFSRSESARARVWLRGLRNLSPLRLRHLREGMRRKQVAF